MSDSASSHSKMQWQQQAEQYLRQEEYDRAATLYEQAIEAEPDVKFHYWYLGLALLLQDKATEAQTTWLMAMLDGEPEQLDRWNQDLIYVLAEEATQQATLGNNAIAFRIREQIQELCPTDLENVLSLTELAIPLERCTKDKIEAIVQLLQSETHPDIAFERLALTLEQVLNYAPLHPAAFEFARACADLAQEEDCIVRMLNLLMPVAVNVGFYQRQPEIGSKFLELGLRLDDNHPEFLTHLASQYQNADRYEEGIETAKRYYNRVENLPDKLHASQILIRGLMKTGGHWQEACEAFANQEVLLESLFSESPLDLHPLIVGRLLHTFFFAPYFRDRPQHNRRIQDQIAQLCQANVEIYAKEAIAQYRQGHRTRKAQQKPDKPLKIGYLSYCLKIHSVGWLARWLIKHHDRDRVQIYLYIIGNAKEGDSLQQWYFQQAHKIEISQNEKVLAQKIYDDEIDILVELDSITLDKTCRVVTQKPAPIQVTWLGWDASGIPTIDYFLADPYVLPASAQDYYTEKIWRLPQTYIAVDGFEMDVPTRRREDFGIDADAVVFFSAQSGMKRHIDTVRLQLKIVKAVPNSHFLLKGTGEVETIQAALRKIAEEEGVDPNRLHFLGFDPSESIHRANLTLATVVLDTYPYNGATTTLETLWMGIPLVTRVGEQFSARNSYTMMLNAGITEGIAWSAEEYVEWGIRFGTDAALRQQVSGKLLQSRQTAPLWNGKQFAREVEEAYQQMWARYLGT